MSLGKIKKQNPDGFLAMRIRLFKAAQCVLLFYYFTHELDMWLLTRNGKVHALGKLLAENIDDTIMIDEMDTTWYFPCVSWVARCNALFYYDLMMFNTIIPTF